MIGMITCWFLLGTAAALNTTEEFRAFKERFGRTYSSDEEARRYEIFAESLARVEARNAQEGNAIFGVTKFSDLDEEEKKAYRNYARRNDSSVRTTSVLSAFASDAPDAFDWRDSKIITRVKNQKQCGGCWAFSSTMAVESAWANAGNELTEFSVQQMLSCDDGEGDSGCVGGDPTYGYRFVKTNGGLASQSAYPFDDKQVDDTDKCKEVAVKGGFVDGFDYATRPCTSGYCTRQDEDTLLKNLVESGAPSICLDASAFDDYVKGIMTEASCSSAAAKQDHCMQLVGYDKSGDVPYWIVRNTWDSDWGIQGYVYLKMGDNTCGLANEASIPRASKA